MRLQAGVVRLVVGLVLVLAGVLAFAGSASAETKTKTFVATEGAEQSFSVPAGVTQIEVTAVGGAGKPGSVCAETPHSYAGGAGAKVIATLNVSETNPCTLISVAAGKAE